MGDGETETGTSSRMRVVNVGRNDSDTTLDLALVVSSCSFCSGLCMEVQVSSHIDLQRYADIPATGMTP